MSTEFNINRQKMVTGEIYDGTDPVLWNERRRVKLLCHKFNALIPPYAPEDVAPYQEVLRELLPNASPDCFIEPTLRCDYGYNIFIDKQVYINCEAHLDDCAPIRIGKRCFLGPAVHIYTATHPIHYKERCSGYEFALPVTIGDDTWLCGRATVCPGVTIGSRCVVAAGSVVTKDIPDDCLAAGVPAKVIRKLTEAERLGLDCREGIHPHSLNVGENFASKDDQTISTVNVDSSSSAVQEDEDAQFVKELSPPPSIFSPLSPSSTPVLDVSVPANKNRPVSIGESVAPFIPIIITSIPNVSKDPITTLEVSPGDSSVGSTHNPASHHLHACSQTASFCLSSPPLRAAMSPAFLSVNGGNFFSNHQEINLALSPNEFTEDK